jgi:hypothetical protein
MTPFSLSECTAGVALLLTTDDKGDWNCSLFILLFEIHADCFHHGVAAECEIKSFFAPS